MGKWNEFHVATLLSRLSVSLSFFLSLFCFRFPQDRSSPVFVRFHLHRYSDGWVSYRPSEREGKREREREGRRKNSAVKGEKGKSRGNENFNADRKSRMMIDLFRRLAIRKPELESALTVPFRSVPRIPPLCIDWMPSMLSLSLFLSPNEQPRKEICYTRKRDLIVLLLRLFLSLRPSPPPSLYARAKQLANPLRQRAENSGNSFLVTAWISIETPCLSTSIDSRLTVTSVMPVFYNGAAVS